jgi:hypothetical protein
MGKAAKRKQRSGNPHQILLSGEQAEAFDAQMDADKAMFEQTDAAVCFRPQIPGEWNEQKMLGLKLPPQLGPIRNGRWDFLPDQCTWTAVVDVIRAQRIADGKDAGEASGCRTRLQCVPVLNQQDEAAYSQIAQEYVLQQLAILREQGGNQ